MSELIWNLYTETILKGYRPEYPEIRISRFGENPQRGALFASRIAEGKTTAAARSAWSYEFRGEPIPEPGDTAVVTNWDGTASAVIRFTEVDVVPFKEMSPEFILQSKDARPEFLKDLYREILEKEAAEAGRTPDDEMPIVCQRFQIVSVLE